MDLELLIPSTWSLFKAFNELYNGSGDASSQALSDLFITATVYIAAFFLFLALMLTVRSIYRTLRYRLALKGVQVYTDVRNKLQDDRNLALFKDLHHHLIDLPLLDGSGRVKLRRSVDAAEIFTDDALAPGFSSSRIFQALPGILTGLGVLGTFIGLQLGIGRLNLSDLKELETSIVPLIQGCAVAFSTSVWGVLTSLAFSFFEKLLEWFALGGVRKLQNRVDQLIPRYVPEEAMAGLESSSRGSEEILKGLAVAIGEKMQEAIGRLGAEIKDAVVNAAREGQAPIAEQSVQLLSTAITAELGKLKETIEGMGQRFTDEFSNASGALMQTVQGFEPTISTLTHTVSSTQETVTEAVGKLNAHENVMQQMADAAEKIHQSASLFSSMNETLETSANRNKEAAEAQHGAAKANHEVAAKFSEVVEKLPEVRLTIEDAARVIASIIGPISDLQTLLAKQPEVLVDIEKNRAASEEERSMRLLVMSNELAKIVSKAVEEFSKVGAIAEQLNSASNSLEEASNELAVFGQQVLQASKEQREASEASRTAAATNEKVARSFEPLPAELAKLTNGLNLAGEKLKEGSESAAETYNRLIDSQQLWFQGVQTGLIALRDRVQEIISSYGNQIEGQTKNLMNEWTTQVTTCLKTFESQVEALQGGLDELQEAISKYNRGKSNRAA